MWSLPLAVAPARYRRAPSVAVRVRAAAVLARIWWDRSGSSTAAGHRQGADEGAEGEDRVTLPGLGVVDEVGNDGDVVAYLLGVGGAGGVADAGDAGGDAGDGRLKLNVDRLGALGETKSLRDGAGRPARRARPGPQRRRAVDHLDAPVEQPRALPAEAREHDVLNEDVARPRRSNTRTSTCWAATASAPPPRLAAACGPLRDPATANADEEG